MRSVLLVVLVVLLFSASPASAAEPAEGRVSLAAPNAAWTGTAAGYGVVVVNSVGARTCQAPACDEFLLTVEERGDLVVGATANGASGFTMLEIVRPDGTTISNDGGADQPTSELRLKGTAPGLYRVRTHTNAPAFADATYSGFASLGPAATGGGAPPPLPEGSGEGGPRDATVVAVIDSSFNPYHWDFGATRMPQALNDDPGDDLPLDRPASEWLPGYSGGPLERVDLTLDEQDPKASMADLTDRDAAKWDAFPQSTAAAPRLAWFPRTKFIAAATFREDGRFVGGNDAHGFGTTSAAVGNLHGTCPECLLVAIQYSGSESGEAAIEWAERQPWIDVISNSYGFHTVSDPTAYTQPRDNVYSGSDTEAQRTAVERGQSIFFSAGNGHGNAFVVPNSTTFSSQKGPDWILTVGAVSPPEDGHYDAFTDAETEEQSGGIAGAGAPVDLAGVGYDYPTGYSASAVGETGSLGFSGTSNATPVVAGTYARSLYRARSLLKGTSRVQSGGAIATGHKFKCGATRPACELGDGVLTIHELRARLLGGAVPTGNGVTVSGQLVNPTLPPVGEETLMWEGHGAYLGRVSRDPNAWLAEHQRIMGPLTGAGAALQRPAGEREWFTVRSYCRQRNWGSWGFGHYVQGKTALPPVALNWPIRSLFVRACPGGPVS
jgi:hypothetical protein